MDVSWQDLEPEFRERTDKIVWCTVTTIDRNGRPRSRILHPVWDGEVGWIATGRNSFKAKHLAAHPYVALSYWDQSHQLAYAECDARWVDDQAEKQRVWDLVKNAPPPVGYDPALFWPEGPASPEFGALRLDPWRVEVGSLQDMMSGKPPRVWRRKS